MPTPVSGELAAIQASLLSLLAEGEFRQQDIADGSYVDQGLVSRLANGSLKRMTKRIRRIESYVNMQKRNVRIPQHVSDAVRAYLHGGGDPALLCETLLLLGRAQRK